MTIISEPTIIDADLGLSVRTDDEGTVILAAEVDDDGEWHFTPDEARRLAGTLLRHSGQADGFARLLEAETEDQTLPPVTCTPWCADGDGHPRETFREDQSCRSEEQATLLTRDYTHPDHTSEVDMMAVAVQRFPGRLPEVALRHTAPDDMAYLTPAEARQTAAALIAAADMLEAGRA